ncbi:hypothetical protein GJ744_005189 [Endocarpon pusillum]|uniref:Potassium transport protein n=1 Tax=Endocarpon pusillum TaxID=364733 RepID=A0A8H7DYV5_9EURO|nr:hypothetical protein GJ744_005189 [Endocarpon pusillum]
MSQLTKCIDHRLPTPVSRVWHTFIRPALPDWSFITVHYLYFILMCLVISLLFWVTSTPSKNVSYVDSLFLVTSAMTEAGLNTVNLSQLNTFQQVLLFFLIILGSAIWVSIATVHIRKRAFEQKLQELADNKKKRLRLSRSLRTSLSKTGKDTSDRRIAAIASGAVRGTALGEGDGRPKDDCSLNADEHITFDLPLQQKADGEHVPLGNLKELSHPAYRGHSSPLSLDANLDSDKNRPATARNDSPDARGTAAKSSVADNMHILEPQRSPAHGCDIDSITISLHRRHTRIFSGHGVGARPSLSSHPRNATLDISPTRSIDDEERASGKRMQSLTFFDKYLKGFNGLIGRNSQFHGLSEKDRRKLGGLEYDALVLLSYLVPTYFFLFQLAGAIGMGAWMQSNQPDVALENGLDPFWTGSFFAISAFNNSGMALLDANAVALQNSYYCLLTLGFLILAGNTCFPPFLRLIIWTGKVCIPRSWNDSKWEKRREVLQFLLDHPRRCYTHLFPRAQTWWLVGTLLVLNGIDWVAFEVLNIGNPATESIPAHFRGLDGLFQAFAVRSGGFYVVSISQLRPALLCLYIYMMYLSALPVTLTLRNTNVYEERSLGIFAEEIANTQASPPQPQPRRDSISEHLASTLRRRITGQTSTSADFPTTTTATTWSRRDFLLQQLRGQLSHDLWWLALAIFLITIIETSQFSRDPINFSVFNIIFECVSAYGCVGISVGVPWDKYSFCGAWHTGSKLVLCAVMLRGRHRGLPVAIDRAVLVPDQRLGWAEEEDAVTRRKRMRLPGGGDAVTTRRRSTP